MRNYFTMDGVDSRDFGLYISGAGTYSAPARRYNVVPIPGRNGDLIYTDGSYENGVLRYSGSFICQDMEANYAAFRAFVMSRNGYVDLVDTYHPNERRQVCYTGSLEPDITPTFSAAEFDLEFSCKPQRWLLSGDETITVLPGDFVTLTNPTPFPAKPLIKIYGNGSFNYNYIDASGGQPLIVITTITVNGPLPIPDYPVVIDAETMEIYQHPGYGNAYVNRSNVVSITNRRIPDIVGTVSISDLSGVDKVEIMPRWWTL